MMTVRVTPLMPQSSDLEWATREVGTEFSMVGALYLLWMTGVLEECHCHGCFTQLMLNSFLLFAKSNSLHIC